MAFQIPLLQRQAGFGIRFRFSPSFPNPCRHRCFPPAGPLLWQAALLLFQTEEKRSCFYVYGRRLSGLNRFFSHHRDFPFPSADGFCRFGNDMFSFSGILLSVLGKYGSVPDRGPAKRPLCICPLFRADAFHTAEFLFGCRAGFCDPTEDCIGKNL